MSLPPPGLMPLQSPESVGKRRKQMILQTPKVHLQSYPENKNKFISVLLDLGIFSLNFEGVKKKKILGLQKKEKEIIPSSRKR